MIYDMSTLEITVIYSCLLWVKLQREIKLQCQCSEPESVPELSSLCLSTAVSYRTSPTGRPGAGTSHPHHQNHTPAATAPTSSTVAKTDTAVVSHVTTTTGGTNAH